MKDLRFNNVNLRGLSFSAATDESKTLMNFSSENLLGFIYQRKSQRTDNQMDTAPPSGRPFQMGWVAMLWLPKQLHLPFYTKQYIP